MANKIDADGLSIDSLPTTKNKLIAYFTDIYGDINVDQNSPDAQIINVFAQMITDVCELLQDINAGFDPDQAVGKILDQRVKYNGIKRYSGEYTTVNVNVKFNASGTIKGLDLYPIEECFQASDVTGNVVVPAKTTSGIDGDVKTVLFRAMEYGALYFPAKSVTTIQTPTIGVESVVNEFAQITVGNTEEADNSLRLRRQVAARRLSLYGDINTLQVALYQIEGIEYCAVVENDGTHDKDEDSYYNTIPLNGIWIILKGVYSNEQVANVIYQKRIAGTPMKGDKTYTIQRDERTSFVARWDDAIETPIHVLIRCRMYNSEFLNANIIAALVSIRFKVGEMADTTTISAKLKEKLPMILIKNLEISTDGQTWGNYLTPNFNEEYVIKEEYIDLKEE